MIRRAALIAAALLAMAAPGSLQAQTEAPAPVKLKLDYDGRLLIKVLDIDLTHDIGAETFTTTARLKSYGVLSMFKKLDQRASATGTIVGGMAHPGVMTQQNIDGRKNRKVVARWTGSDVVATANPDFPNWGEPPATRAQKVVAADPLTQITRIALASTQAGPCAGDTRFFDGKYLYKIDFTAPRPTQLSARARKLGLVNGVHCSVTFEEVAGFGAKKPGSKTNQGLDRPISVDFAQVGRGGPWVIALLRAGTPLGDAIIELMSVETARPS
jgi:hypothetical protein